MEEIQMHKWYMNFGFAISLIYLLTGCTPERLIMTSESQQVRSQEVLNSSEQKPELVVQKGHTEDVTAVVFSADGTLLATGSQDDTIKLWDTGTQGIGSDGNLIRKWI
jgi:WD40 repeat protein